MTIAFKLLVNLVSNVLFIAFFYFNSVDIVLIAGRKRSVTAVRLWPPPSLHSSNKWDSPPSRTAPR